MMKEVKGITTHELPSTGVREETTKDDEDGESLHIKSRNLNLKRLWKAPINLRLSISAKQ